MFACYEIQSFHNKNRENKRYDRMCLLSAYFKTNRFVSAHKIEIGGKRNLILNLFSTRDCPLTGRYLQP